MLFVYPKVSLYVHAIKFINWGGGEWDSAIHFTLALVAHHTRHQTIARKNYMHVWPCWRYVGRGSLDEGSLCSDPTETVVNDTCWNQLFGLTLLSKCMVWFPNPISNSRQSIVPDLLHTGRTGRKFSGENLATEVMAGEPLAGRLDFMVGLRQILTQG